ncbi:MAG: hypothetical protein ACXIUZ_09880 [Lysobacteraceae bacterium]
MTRNNPAFATAIALLLGFVAPSAAGLTVEPPDFEVMAERAQLAAFVRVIHATTPERPDPECRFIYRLQTLKTLKGSPVVEVCTHQGLTMGSAYFLMGTPRPLDGLPPAMAGGTPETFFRTDPSRWEFEDIRWVFFGIHPYAFAQRFGPVSNETARCTVETADRDLVNFCTRWPPAVRARDLIAFFEELADSPDARLTRVEHD